MTDFVLPFLENFESTKVEEFELVLRLLDHMSKHPEIKQLVHANYSPLVRAALLAQTQVDLDRAKRKDEAANPLFEKAVTNLCQSFEISLKHVFAEVQKLLTLNLLQLGNEEPEDLTKPTEVCPLTVAVQAIEASTRLICDRQDHAQTKSILKRHLSLVLEVDANQVGQRPQVVNHANILVRRAAIMSLVDLKLELEASPELGQLLSQLLSTLLNPGQRQIVAIYFDKRRAANQSLRPSTSSST